jgi:hypothetical protein
LEKDEEKQSEDSRIQQEIRLSRKFSFNQALAEKGGGLMKGGSPVARLKQIHLELEDFLEKALEDSEGALTVVLHRRLHLSDSILGEYLDYPKTGLKIVVEQILSSETSLYDFLREVDAQWGRMYQERPIFNVPGKVAGQGDPYTPESVRQALEKVLASIKS